MATKGRCGGRGYNNNANDQKVRMGLEPNQPKHYQKLRSRVDAIYTDNRTREVEEGEMKTTGINKSQHDWQVRCTDRQCIKDIQVEEAKRKYSNRKDDDVTTKLFTINTNMTRYRLFLEYNWMLGDSFGILGE